MSSRKRSIAWTFFKKSTQKSTLAECVFCGVCVAHSNTSNLLEHLRGKHRAETRDLWNEELTPEIQLNCSDEQSLSTPKQCTKTEDEELNLGSDTIIYSEETSDHLANDEQDIEADRKRLDEASTSSIKLDSPGNRKCRSVVWMCFEKSADHAASAVCTLCGKNIRQVCGSTSNLLKHLLNKHPVEHESIVSDRSLTISCESFPVEKEPRAVGRCSGLKRRSRSILWEYFMKNSADESQVMCSFCGRMLKQPIGSTSNLIKHLYAKHRNEYRKLYPDENSVDDVVLPADNYELHSTGMRIGYVETDDLDCLDPKEEPEDEKEEDDDDNEEEDGEEVDASIPEMFTKVQNIWLKHCEEREKEFIRFMMTKRKEVAHIHETMRKLKHQVALLSKDVRRQESKRRVELRRQEQMDRQFLTQKEANVRKQKYDRNFRQACNLVKGSFSGHTSSSNPLSAAKETETCEEVANEVIVGSENGLRASQPDYAVAMGIVPVDTVAMDGWPEGAFSENNVDGSTESRRRVAPPLNKIKRRGWSCNTTGRSSKRKKTG